MVQWPLFSFLIPQQKLVIDHGHPLPLSLGMASDSFCA